MRTRLASKTKARIAAVVFAAVCAVGLGAVQIAEAAGGGVLKVRLGGDAAETRVVLDLDRSVTGKLIEDGSEGRIVVALSEVDAPFTLEGEGQGLVRRWSVTRKNGQARLTVELAAEAEVRRRFLLPPGDGVENYRYVVDVKASGDAPVLTKAVAPKVMVAQGAARTGKRVIVIDAGHGGKDPGAKGADSIEKDITLASARALKARLEKSGKYKVVMTRDSDVFVPLEQRVRIARKADADLFLSLHADAGPSSDTRGLSVYTLSEKGAERSTKVMSKDDWLMNASYAGNNRAVGQILFDLTQRSTKNRSAQFAEILLEKVGDHTTLLRRSHRDAGFVVLLAPDVPAVLLEMGFITNRDDEKFLAEAAGRRKLMGAVGDSIDAYFAEQTRLASR